MAGQPASTDSQSRSETSDERTFSLAELEQMLDQVDRQRLKPLSPSEAFERYLDRKADDIRETTRKEYRRKLEFFRKYCTEYEIKTLDELDRALVDGYYTWRRDDSTAVVDRLQPKTLNDDMYLLREFLEYLEGIRAVEPGLSEAVRIADISDEDEYRDDKLDADRASEIIEYLAQFHYASHWHILFVLLAETGRRRSGLYALDCEDVHTDAEPPYLEFVHRPEQGTALKNGEASEDKVFLSEWACDVLEAYLDHQRHDVTDTYGRQPLLTSSDGRLSKATIKKYCYMLTRPCFIGEGCPHDRDPEVCKAAQKNHRAFECPSSKATHAVRTGYLTEMRNQNIPKSVLSDRCDVSPEVLDEHYDMGDEDDRLARRTAILKDLEENGDGGYTGGLNT